MIKPKILERLGEHRHHPRLHLPKPQYQRSALGRSWDRVRLWSASKCFTFLLTIFASLLSRLRMSHNNGLVASGRLTIVDKPEFPLHPLFVPGKVFECRIRHAAASFLDDAMRCVRSGSLKFSDADFESPFDLEMNTGKIALFWSAASFLQFAFKKKQRYGIQYTEYYRHQSVGTEGAYDGLRRNPESYADQHYYNQTPLYYVTPDGTIRYAKYRLVPDDTKTEESGTVVGDLAEMDIGPGDQRILPGEKRSRNYLRDEYKARLMAGPVRYRLQIQLHEAQEDDDPEIFNSCREWDPETHPFMDLAVVEIDRKLDWETSCMTSYSLRNAPAGLGVLPSDSVYDYNSLNYLRSHSELARRTRLWSYRTFGVLPAIPDDDQRNQ